MSAEVPEAASAEEQKVSVRRWLGGLREPGVAGSLAGGPAGARPDGAFRWWLPGDPTRDGRLLPQPEPPEAWTPNASPWCLNVSLEYAREPGLGLMPGTQVLL